MDDKQAIYWHQGMFMQPQHFQLADLQARFQIKPIVESGLPHFWGVGQLDLASAAVAKRTIDVRCTRLIFPDRTYVEYPGNAALVPRRFDDAAIADGQTLTVYLGLRKLAPEGNNVTMCETLDEAAVAQTRFACLARPPETPDLYSDGAPAPVHTLVHVLKVFFAGEIENLGQYELIPIAQLVRAGDTVSMSERFIAPCYALAGSSPLLEIARNIRDELSARAQRLQELKNPGEMQKAEFDPGFMSLLLVLRTLSRASPYFAHLVQTPEVHPWLVYGALGQLIGELSVFSARFDMTGAATDGTPGLPAYDHTDLHACFARAESLLGYLLNEIALGPEHLTILEYRDGVFAGELPRNFFDRRNRFYLVLHSGEPAANLIAAAERDARLAAAEDIPRLIAHALPGLELIHMPNAPQGLPRRAASHCFRVEQASELWDAVEHDERIALQWPDAPQDLKAEIVVLRR